MWLPVDELPEDAVTAIKAEFTHDNPQHHKLKRMGFSTYRKGGNEPATIRTWVEDDGLLSVPRGGMARLRDVLRSEGLSWKAIDERSEGDPLLAGHVPPHCFAGKLWEHQEKVVEAILKRENCLVRSPTGSGKTTAAIAFIERVQLPTLVVVWESGLMRQWEERLRRELGLHAGDIGLIRGKTFRPMGITLSMQQTLWKLSDDAWREINRTFGVVICDEVQRFAARTFLQTVDRFTARYRVGLSADETRKDRKEFLVYDVFGGVAASVSQDKLVEKGLVHEVHVRVLPTSFRADWYVEHRQKWKDGSDDVDGPPDYNRLLDEMEADEDRNHLAMEWALTEAGLNRNVLVFSQRRDHCRRLNAKAVEAGYNAGLLLGGADPNDVAEFARVVARIDTGEQRVACGTLQAIGQGHDWPKIHRGVVTTPVANKQTWGQVRGRICRTTDGKQDAAIYYLWDRDLFGDGPLRNLRKWNKHVTVHDGEKWVDASDYLKKQRRR